MPELIDCVNLAQIDQDIVDAERELIYKDPYVLVEGEFLTIQTKDSRLMKLKLNNCQIELLNEIRELRREGKPVRLWILKARQEGVSTVVEAIIYALAAHGENVNALIMADELDHSDHLFNMTKLYHEQLACAPQDRHLAPRLKKSNAKELVFEDIHSQILIETADNTSAARSMTYQIVHLSEIAFFKNFIEVMTALNSSVPDLPNTMIIGETTANGRNEFYHAWRRAKQGKSDWKALFIPFYWHEDYYKPLEVYGLYPLEGIVFDAENTEAKFLEEEQWLRSKLRLCEEQINWRRWAITNKCEGDIKKFKREYPATDEEAFQTSGSNYFNMDALKKQKAIQPIRIGEIFYLDGRYEFRDIDHGRVKLYREPEDSGQYIGAGDASEAVGLDEASCLIRDKRTNEIVCVANGHYAPEELEHIMVMMGNYYNGCLLMPENKGYGYGLCQGIYKRYGNVYKSVKTRTGVVERTEEIGFNTNSVTRPEMLAIFAEDVRTNNCKLNDADLIEQCETFIINPSTYKPEACEGGQDGLVICAAITAYGRRLFPYNVSQSSGKGKEIIKALQYDYIKKLKNRKHYSKAG